MPHLIMELHAYRLRNKSIFRRTIQIYDEYVLYKRRSWFKMHEVTMTYNHITQVNIDTGIVFAHMELISSSSSANIQIRYLFKKPALKAKAIIEKKIHLAHNKEHMSIFNNKNLGSKIAGLEMSLDRLQELLHRGKINKKEYNKRRDKLVKKID